MFDVVVITAANEAQAEGYRAQVNWRRGSLPAKDVVVIPDPGGERVGSLGATVNALKTLITTSLSSRITPWKKGNPFSGRRILICHSGGDSRRTPAYAAIGKAFTPMQGSITLFDRIVASMNALPAPGEGQVLVCSGDVLLTFESERMDFSRPGVTGVAYRDSLWQGARHGVYVTNGADASFAKVAAFVQKPSEAVARKVGAVNKDDQVLVDTGVLSIDPSTAMKMVQVGWECGDIYAEFPKLLLGGFAPFTVNIATRLDFFHIGSSRELLENLYGIRNCRLEGPVTGADDCGRADGKILLDGCYVSQGAELELAGNNIVTNMPHSFRGKLSLARDEGAVFLPNASGEWRLIRYHLDDNFKTDGKWESTGMGELVRHVDYGRMLAERDLIRTFTVTAPVRIDLAGGWSDTPPICNDMGGTVVNAALTIEGRRPIVVTVKPAPYGVVVRSLDLGNRTILRTDDEIADHKDPHDWCSLVKSALTVVGYRIADGGVEVTINADLPKGSGMGTSSILGACTVAALRRYQGLSYSASKTSELTLQLEQEMTTCGGWQDQMGAIYGGIKIIRSEKGEMQFPIGERLDPPRKFMDELRSRGILYFTGQKRMARNILRKITSFYQENEGGKAQALVVRLKQNAENCAAAIRAGDFDGLCKAVNDYWETKKLLDHGSTNDRVERIAANIAKYTSALTLTGAGGGGFMFVIAKSAEDAEKIRKILSAGEKDNRYASLYGFEFTEEGLRFE